MNHRSSLLAFAALGVVAGAAQASLTPLGFEDMTGTGLGAVNTVLTITSPASGTFEQGSVGLDAGGAMVSTGDTTAITQTRTLGELGVSSAADLRIVFNASEPGNGENGITLSDLVLNIYSPSGALLFTSGAFSPVSFGATALGVGQAGFIFTLDAAQAAAAQAAAFGGDFAVNQIGLSAAAGCATTPSDSCLSATGGLETFFVTNAEGGGGVVAEVPELGTYALILAGLGAIGLVNGRRRV